MKFLSPRVALCLSKSTIRLYVGYCCNVWAGIPSCYLDLLENLKKQVFRFVAASIELLSQRRNVVSLSLFYSNYFIRCLIELDKLVPLPYSPGRPLAIYPLDFSVTIPRFFKDVHVKYFFSRTARPWNSSNAVCFLDGFKFVVNRHVLTVGPF